MPEAKVRHFFIFNPAAGKRGAKARLDAALAALPSGSFELYITKGIGDAARFARQVCQETEGPLRLYACGGDGTLGEVATGALGREGAEIGAWPCGSGNDYVKCFGGETRFLDVKALMEADSVPVDLMQVGERCAINAINAGLEAEAASTMLRFRHRPLFNGKNGYFLGAVDAVIRHMRTSCAVTADGESLHEGEMLTLSLACGQYIGGSFRCAPRSSYDDGLMDLALVKPIGRLLLARVIGGYQRGEHLDDPRLKDRIIYRRARAVRVSSKEDLTLCLDGEIVRGRQFDIRILPGAVRFIVPGA